MLLRATTLNTTLALQFGAACFAIYGCAQLSRRLQLQQGDAFRLASSLEIVFGAGIGILQERVTAAATHPTGLAALLQELNRQLGAANAALGCAANPQRQPAAAAAFFRTAGRPQAVLPWMLAVSQALLVLPATFRGTLHEPLDDIEAVG